MDRSVSHRTRLKGITTTCQFEGGGLISHDGKDWCEFHLPLSAKVGWPEERTAEFNARVIALVRQAARDKSLLDLSGVTFPKAVQFDNTWEPLVIPDALFMGCVFAGDVRFENVEFAGWVYFDGTRFLGSALLHEITYHGEAGFHGVDFGPNVHLGPSEFRDNAYFQSARFRSNTWCSDVRFAGRAWFHNAELSGIAYFERCTFVGEVDFGVPQPDQSKWTLPRISFNGSQFQDRACFTNRRFSSSTSFAGCVFRVAPEFHGCQFHQDTDLSRTSFLDRGNAERQVICEVYPQPVDAARAYRTLKHAMEALRNAEDEARFRALEQESLRNAGKQAAPAEAVEEQLPYRVDEQEWMKALPSIAATDEETFRGAASGTDVLLFTVKDAERDAVLRLMEPHDGQHILQGFIGQETYYFGKFGAYRTVLTTCAQGSLGREGSTLATNFGIREWKPAAVVMVGFAWGAGPRHPSQQMTDVLVSASIIPFDPRRESVDGMSPRGIPIPAGPVLLNRFRHVHGSGFKRPDGSVPKVHIGPVLSGEWLVDNLRRKLELLEWFPNSIGGEMEGTGVSSAAARFENLTEWIVIKSICDWADGSKTKGHQPLAAATAASFAHHVLLNPHALASLTARTRAK